jgi:hypothetical protein
MINLERLLERLTETPSRLIETLSAVTIGGAFMWNHTLNGVANGIIAGLSAVVIMRWTGASRWVAGALGLGPSDRLQRAVRARDFDKFPVVDIDGKAAEPWHRLARIQLHGGGSKPRDIYDILLNPRSVGSNRGHPVFRTILFRHRDEHIWPTDIMFDYGIVQFELEKFDPDLPPVRVSLRIGEVSKTVQRRMETGGRPDPERRAPRSAGNKFDAIAAAIIGDGPKSRSDRDRMRRKIGMEIHPDRGGPDERAARGAAMARANVILDQFSVR